MQEEKEKHIVIVVNGREKEVEKKESMNYREIVILAFDQFDESPNVVYTVTYSKGKHGKGTLVDVQEVTVKKEMVFNVTKTDKS
jgi:hypothetical protein